MSSYLGGTSSGLGQALVAMSPEEQKDFAASMVGTAIDFTPIVGEAKSFAVKGVLSSVGSLANKAAQNTPTRIPEFYTNPVKGAINFGKEYTKAVVPAIKESIDPQAVAKRRVVGMSDTKIDDWISEVGQDAEKTAISINRQLGAPEDTLIEKSIVGLNYLDSRIPREDVATLSSAIGQGFRTSGTIPNSIVERATKHLTDGPHVSNPRGRYE